MAATYSACCGSINRLVMPPISPRIDSSISSQEMSRCESILSLPTLPSFPVLPLVPSQNRHRHHHPSSPVPSTTSPSPLLPTIPHVQSPLLLTSSRTHRTPHHRRASRVLPLHHQPPTSPNPSNWPTSHSSSRAAQLYTPIEHVETPWLLLLRTAILPSVTRTVNFTPHVCLSHGSRSPAWPRCMQPYCTLTLPWMVMSSALRPAVRRIASLHD